MTPKSVASYIAPFPPKVRAVLKKVRAVVRKAAPRAEEKISYGIPAYRLNGILVYFGGFKNHIGLYPPVRDPRLKKMASKYAGEKGNLRFPLDHPIPYGLIARIVKARLRENLAKAGTKGRKKARRRS